MTSDAGLFITQRTHPQMSQVQTRLDQESLTVEAPGLHPLSIPIHQRSTEICEVSIFGKKAGAEKVGAIFDEWFSDFLKQKVQLVRSPLGSKRTTSGRRGPVTSILFPDGYPLLLTNQKTLDELNEKLPEPVRMSRFRPNVLVSGAGANEEDLWKSFSIGSIPFLSVKACVRCAIIDVNPVTGEKSKTVSKTLKSYRTHDGQIVFGNNLIHQGTGTIAIGDRLHSIL